MKNNKFFEVNCEYIFKTTTNEIKWMRINKYKTVSLIIIVYKCN